MSCFQKPASPVIQEQASDALPYLPVVSQGIVTSADEVMSFDSVVHLSVRRKLLLNFDRLS